MTKVSHDSETPAHKQQVITACAFIHQRVNGEEKVFSAKRALTKKFLPGVWELPGGHIDFGEAVVEGLKREVLEELGVNITVGDPFAAFSYENKIKGSHSVEIIYFCSFKDPSATVKLKSEDHSECGWFTESELERAFIATKRKDDPEFQVVRKGFQLIQGGKPNFA